MALHQPLQQVLQGPHPGARVLLEGPPGLEQSRPSRVADEPVSQETLNYISQRVNSMLGHATTSSEWQVRAELRRMQPSFTAMKEKIQRVDMLLNAKVKGKEPVSQENLDRFLANIDQRREQELSLVKRDLHHTIMGHNHNADLMADHKVAIGTIYGMIEDKPDKPALAQVSESEAGTKTRFQSSTKGTGESGGQGGEEWFQGYAQSILRRPGQLFAPKEVLLDVLPLSAVWTGGFILFNASALHMSPGMVNVIRCMEPLATICVGFALGQRFSCQVLATLLPICGGAACRTFCLQRLQRNKLNQLDDLAIFFNVSLVSALFLPGLELVVEASEAPFVQLLVMSKLSPLAFSVLTPIVKATHAFMIVTLTLCYGDRISVLSASGIALSVGGIGKRSFSICYRFQLRLRERWVNRMSIIYWTVVRQFCSGSTTSLHQLQLPCTIIRQAYHQDTAWLTCHPMGHQIPTWVAGFQGICLWVILSIPASAFDTFQCGCLEIRDRHCLYGLPGP
eukprot:s2076_g10.t3